MYQELLDALLNTFGAINRISDFKLNHQSYVQQRYLVQSLMQLEEVARGLTCAIIDVAERNIKDEDEQT